MIRTKKIKNPVKTRIFLVLDATLLGFLHLQHRKYLIMKRYALLVFAFVSLCTSCSLESKGPDGFYLEVVPIDSVEMPEYFVQGEIYEINITYTQPNSCYYFNDFIYEIDGQERTVVVVNTVYTDDSNTCIDNPEEVTVHFNFSVTGNETYVFKFYQGEDEEGEDQYYIVEVPVMEGRPDSRNQAQVKD
ncbi:hypothetical protein [Winogradskyella forsetii]|uniref:hypothetical protein n=1 Tax=Winogradskyella forsetii TaxID=2686077 RepID=UPI0015BB8029|nr:hypothetical protein [Winogradskyella forsetii]